MRASSKTLTRLVAVTDLFDRLQFDASKPSTKLRMTLCNGETLTLTVNCSNTLQELYDHCRTCVSMEPNNANKRRRVSALPLTTQFVLVSRMSQVPLAEYAKTIEELNLKNVALLQKLA